MSDTLHDFLTNRRAAQFATDAGTRRHERMRHIGYKNGARTGDTSIWDKIDANAALAPFFTPLSRTEVPIAGYIGDRFVSRRIDRLAIDNAAKLIRVLDYKTDTNPGVMRDKYASQIREYITLIGVAYPGYDVMGYILWLHDWRLDKIA